MFVGSGKVTPVGPPVARVGDAVPVDLLHGLLEHAERGGGPEIAVAGESCSPAELIDRADRLADRLTPGVSVAVRASGSLDTVVAVPSKS